MDWGLKDIIAIYAAFLSTFVFLWNVYNSRSKISVEVTHGADDIDGKFRNGIYVFIKNPSPHKVYVTSVSLAYPYKEVKFIDRLKHISTYKRVHRYIEWVHTHLVFDGINTGLPVAIEPRNAHSIFVPEENLKEMLSDCINNTFVAVVQDALWRNKYSPVFKM